jgi:hypothetical protein
MKNTGGTAIEFTQPKLNIVYYPYGNILFEFGPSNRLDGKDINNATTRIVYADEKTVVVLTSWSVMHANYSVTWIFLKDSPYFYVDFYASFDGKYRIEGEGWQVCIFNSFAQENAVLDYFGNVIINQGSISLINPMVMTIKKTFPWMVAYNLDNGVAIGAILLYSYPPVAGANNHRDGTEMQFTFVPRLMAGYPEDRVIIKLAIYPHITDRNTRYLKTAQLAEELYGGHGFRETYQGLRRAQVMFFGTDPNPFAQREKRLIAYNSFSRLEIWKLQGLGVTLWRGYVSNHYSANEAQIVRSLNLLGTLINSTGQYTNSLIASPDLMYKEDIGDCATGFVAGTSYPFHVNITVNTCVVEEFFSLKIRWRLIDNVNISKFFITFDRGFKNVEAVLLNSSAAEYYYNDSYYGRIGVLIHIGNNASFIKQGSSTIIYLINNTEPKLYLSNTILELDLIIKPYYQHKDLYIITSENFLFKNPVFNTSLLSNAVPLSIKKIGEWYHVRFYLNPHFNDKTNSLRIMLTEWRDENPVIIPLSYGEENIVDVLIYSKEHDVILISGKIAGVHETTNNLTSRSLTLEIIPSDKETYITGLFKQGLPTIIKLDNYRLCNLKELNDNSGNFCNLINLTNNSFIALLKETNLTEITLIWIKGEFTEQSTTTNVTSSRVTNLTTTIGNTLSNTMLNNTSSSQQLITSSQNTFSISAIKFLYITIAVLALMSLLLTLLIRKTIRKSG